MLPFSIWSADYIDLKNPSILQKDSIYAAIGLAAPILGQKLDFGAFLESTLVPEVQIQKPGYNIIRRRIAIILGQWLGVKEVLNRSLVYQIFQHLLDIRDPLNDQVVRVTAGRQLKNVIDPFEFVAEDFMPFAQIILNRLTELIDEVELIETKMALVNTITAVVVRMEHHVCRSLKFRATRVNFKTDLAICKPAFLPSLYLVGSCRRGVSHEANNFSCVVRPGDFHARGFSKIPPGYNSFNQ